MAGAQWERGKQRLRAAGRAVRQAPPKTKTFWGVVAGLALLGAQELVKLGVEAMKPMVLGLVGPPRPNTDVRGEWTALYRSPVLVNEDVRPEADVTKAAHEPGQQIWDIKNKSDALFIDISEAKEGGQKGQQVWEATGFLKQDSLVGSLRGKNIGRGTFYLQRHKRWNYYYGYFQLCDCQSPLSQAVMVCPVVLFDSKEQMQREQANKDPLWTSNQVCSSAKSPVPLMPRASDPASSIAVTK